MKMGIARAPARLRPDHRGIAPRPTGMLTRDARRGGTEEVRFRPGARRRFPVQQAVIPASAESSHANSAFFSDPGRSVPGISWLLSLRVFPGATPVFMSPGNRAERASSPGNLNKLIPPSGPRGKKGCCEHFAKPLHCKLFPFWCYLADCGVGSRSSGNLLGLVGIESWVQYLDCIGGPFHRPRVHCLSIHSPGR